MDEILCTIEILFDFFHYSRRQTGTQYMHTYQMCMHMHHPTTLLLLERFAVAHHL